MKVYRINADIRLSQAVVNDDDEELKSVEFEHPDGGDDEMVKWRVVMDRIIRGLQDEARRM